MPQFKCPFKEILIVWWLDAYTSTDEIPEYVDGKDHLTISIGVKVKEDKDFVYISNYYDGVSNTFNDPWTSIPKGMIRRQQNIDLKKLGLSDETCKTKRRNKRA